MAQQGILALTGLCSMAGVIASQDNESAGVVILTDLDALTE
jgi:hypothetical protein